MRLSEASRQLKLTGKDMCCRQLKLMAKGYHWLWNDFTKKCDAMKSRRGWRGSPGYCGFKSLSVKIR